MFKENDMVLYGTQGVCMIAEVTERKFKEKLMKYYVLKPVYKEGATVFVPVDNQELISKMKKVLSVDEIHQLIQNMPESVTIEWINNDNLRRDKYKEIMKSGDRQDLVSLIRTLYLKQEELKEIGKKLHATDLNIFNEAENILYEEFAYVLNIQKDEVGPFILKQIDVEAKVA